MAKNMKNKVLDVNDLHVSFDTYAGEVQAVRGVTFQLHEGEVLAIVGESGCGKSVTAQTIMKLNPMPPARIPQGEVHLGEHDIVKASEKEMQQLRGKEVSMIFQDPMTCLNPTKQVGKQIVEAIRHHQNLSAKEAKEQAIKYLKLVNIPNAEERAKQYPHRVLRRHAPARHDCHGPLLQPQGAHCRRAHHGLGRDHPGPDYGLAGGD